MKIRFTAPPQQANQQNGVPVRYAAAKRQIPRLRWYLLVLLVSAPLVYLAARILIGVVWDSSPGFVALPQSTLKAGASGRLEWLVQPGDVVAAGSLLARIRPEGIAVPAATDSAALPERQRWEAQGLQGRQQLADAVLRLAEQQQQRMAQRVAVVNQLIQQGAATQAERAQAEAQLAAARSDVLRAQSDAMGTRSALGRLALERQSASPQSPVPPVALASEVLAPVAGTIVRTLANGQEWVLPGTELLLLQGQEEPEIHVFINPADERNARPGERAVLRFLDGDKIAATVVRIAPETARIPADRVGPLAGRLQSIVAVLKPDQPLPAKYRIGDLPLDVRFQRLGF